MTDLQQKGTSPRTDTPLFCHLSVPGVDWNQWYCFHPDAWGCFSIQSIKKGISVQESAFYH